MRPRPLLAAATFAVLGVAAFFVFSKPIDRITPENFERLSQGMTEPDVLKLLGEPGTGKQFALPALAVVNLSWNASAQEQTWYGEAHYISVSFDENGIVTTAHLGQVWRPEQGESGLWFRIRQWFGYAGDAPKSLPMPESSRPFTAGASEGASQ